MTFKELHYFLVLAKLGRYGSAARSCGVTSCTLSLMIKKLEQDLGVTLFDRDASGVTLTPIGVRLASHARAIIRHAGQMQELARQGQQGDVPIAPDGGVGQHGAPA